MSYAAAEIVAIALIGASFAACVLLLTVPVRLAWRVARRPHPVSIMPRSWVLLVVGCTILWGFGAWARGGFAPMH